MSGKSKEICVTIPSRLEELTRIEQLTEDVATKLSLSEDSRDNLAIAVTEAVGNAIVHGNKKDPKKKVMLKFKLRDNFVDVAVTDQGGGFKPDDLADPLDPANLMKESGRGIFILKSLMDDVCFEFSEEGTTLKFSMKLEK